VVFLVWTQLAGLIVARVITGLSLGMTTPTATAYLRELLALSRSRPTTDAELIRRARLSAALALTVGLGGRV
jgi:MFS family permease